MPICNKKKYWIQLLYGKPPNGSPLDFLQNVPTHRANQTINGFYNITADGQFNTLIDMTVIKLTTQYY